ncbi:hypothetical protein N186_07565 [Thermofilum adornatum]|uniref:Uncharacterized protein n=1 Tax=Thermofilum adornatum TaxID=1365176 RepID=S5ZMN4_9CREN|nr:hypothetical protein N186_07565 [Thermofilum adornatum]
MKISLFLTVSKLAPSLKYFLDISARTNGRLIPSFIQ